MSKNEGTVKVCRVCGKKLKTLHPLRKYCSFNCAEIARKQLDTRRIVNKLRIQKSGKPLNIKSDFALLTSDWHIPFDKPEYIGTVLQIAENMGIPDIAIIGDFWDCDNYTRYTRYKIDKTFQDEIKFVAARLKLLIEAFDNIYFCVGNHEARFLAANATGNAQGHLLYQQMMNMTGITEGYTVTNNRWMTLNNEWRLTHPKNYSTRKLSVARRLADKYQMNIINTHGHYTTGTPIGQAVMEPEYHIVKDRDTNVTRGVFRVADIGGLFDPTKMEYLTLIDSTYPQLNPGFAIYDHGKVTIIDLEKYLTEESR